MSQKILFIAWLFTDQDDSGSLGPFAEDGLRRIRVKIATLAGLRCTSEERQCEAIRKEPLCTWK